MGKQATAPAAPRCPVPGLKQIVIFGVSPGHPLAAPIRRFLGPHTSFYPDLAPPRKNDACDLAVAIQTSDCQAANLSVVRWALDSAVPCLGVRIDPSEFIIGPLAVPGQAGCLNCARERLLAASPSPERNRESSLLSSQSAGLLASWVAREIRDIRRHGPEHSRLAGQIRIVNTTSRASSTHRVIPLSRCPVCGGAAAFPASNAKPAAISAAYPPERLIRSLGGWLDWRTGIVAGLRLASPEDTGLHLPVVATAMPPHIIDETGARKRLPLGWGKGLTISNAILSAVGEAIERYAPSIPDYQRICFAPLSGLRGHVLNPRRFPLYSEADYRREGFPYSRFDPDLVHPWVSGSWLGGGDSVWIPAVLAFLSLTLEPGQLICQGTSNGLAAHVDSDRAALSAILELVERDAFLTSWLTASPGRRISLDDSLSPELRAILEGIEHLGASVELYSLETAACGTVVLCLALGDGSRYPGATLGLGCGLEPGVALQQAILELGQTGPHLRRMMCTGALPVPRDAAAVNRMLDHATWFFPAERSREFDRIRGEHNPIALRDFIPRKSPKPSLHACAQALATAGIRVALVDVTSPDVAAGPFRVIRAISPDLQPLWYGYGLERQLVPRIHSMKVARPLPPIHPIW